MASTASSLRSAFSTDCELESLEEEMYERVKPSLRSLGTRRSRLVVKDIQIGLGISPPLAALQHLTTLGRSPTVTEKSEMLNSDLSYTGYVSYIDTFCCVLLSLHCGVMRRVRLRDVMALACLTWLREEVSILPGYSSREESTGRLVSVLESQLRPDNILVALIGREADEETRREAQGNILSLIQSTLKLAKSTGYFGGVLTACWPNVNPALGQFEIFESQQAWVKILSDTEVASSFIYVTSCCLETPECRCSGKTPWNPPKMFRLDTRLSLFNDRVNNSIPDGGAGLKVGKIYSINSHDLDMYGVVLAEDKSRLETKLYLATKRSILGRLRWYASDRRAVREYPNGESCVIGSGSIFTK
jgi:hypothetical protein